MSFKEIYRALRVLHEDPDEDFLFEIRAPKHPNDKNPDRPFTKRGWFKNDVDGLLRAADTIWQLNRAEVVPGIYNMLNAVADLDRFTVRDEIGWQSGATQDEDIRYRRWLLVDVDPGRPTGLSATDGEKAAAFEVLEKVCAELRSQGFPDPVVGDSGNGGHLLYSIRFPNTEEVAQRLQFFLKMLDHGFGTKAANVDLVVWNAARISKVYGTFSRKGEDTEERPHRMSKLLEIPEHIEQVDPSLFASLTDLAFRPKPRPVSRPSRSPSRRTSRSASGRSFDVTDLLNRAGIGFWTAQNGSLTLYHLDECPIDSSHEKGRTDTTVFEDSSGALGFKCLHNRCQGHDWRSCRQRLEAMAG